MLRKHQKETAQVIDGIIDDSGVKKIILSVVPAGGKSSIPVMAGKLIDAGLADALAWFVPRHSLQDQGERAFLDPFIRNLTGQEKVIRSATNEINPCRGTNGFVTTYQAIGVDRRRVVAREISKKRYITVFDEYHHIEEGGIWHRALSPIVEMSEFVILMTGTLKRGDKRPIAFTPYEGQKPVLKSGGKIHVVRYTRRDALGEKAILPVKFRLFDGRFEWQYKKEDKAWGRKAISSFQDVDTKDDQRAALYTALNTDFSAEIMRECLIHWQRYKKQNNRAKLLVVTANYHSAKAALEILRNLGIQSDIAISHYSAHAQEAIKRFKGKLDVLVTIAMAYEGLDVPPVSHICCLTHIRSVPWIEQMIARGCRIDRYAGPYESQFCFVFAPKDVRFVDVVNKIRSDQNEAVKLVRDIKFKDDEEDEDEERDPEYNPEGIDPLASELTEKSRVDLDDTHNVVNGDEGLNAINIDVGSIKTVKEKERELRTKIYKTINRFAINNGYDIKKINAEVREKFPKPRHQMTVLELKQLMEYVVLNYPSYIGPVLTEPPPGVSKARSKKERVSREILEMRPVTTDLFGGF